MTLMTVGYGDVIPVSAAGKFIASVAMICGERGELGALWSEERQAPAFSCPYALDLTSTIKHAPPLTSRILLPQHTHTHTHMLGTRTHNPKHANTHTHTHARARTTPSAGVLSLALPISVVGTTFSNDWEAHVADERRRMAVTHRKSLVVTSPALLRLHKLLTRHLNHVDVLGDLNRASELALDDAASSIHGRVKATKKHLHTEAKAVRVGA